MTVKAVEEMAIMVANVITTAVVAEDVDSAEG